MAEQSRRQFLNSVGQGMLVATVGYHPALELGLTSAFADEGSRGLSFGPLEPLACLMAETPIDRLLPGLVARLQAGTPLKDLVAAAALANARAFGGEDYVGYHVLMALGPAFQMAQQLPVERQPLPVLKVLYRNCNRLQEHGGRANEVLRPVAPLAGSVRTDGEALRELVHRGEVAAAEQTLAAIAACSPEQAYNDLLVTVHESPDVHRVVLAHRAWDILDIVGQEHALTMLRQALRYCIDNEQHALKWYSEPRVLLPRLLEQFGLQNGASGQKEVDDCWIDSMSQELFASTAPQAAEAAAAALAEGINPRAIADAVAVAANQLLLRDAGRQQDAVQPNKPLGSVHGDSIGVHACDSAHAWRGIARVANPRNRAASLILAAYQVALDRVQRGGSFLDWKPRPYQEDLDRLDTTEASALVAQLDAAIREQDQNMACAVVHRYGELGYSASGVLEVLRRYAISEDGALHAEKYFRTATEEFQALGAPFRWRQLVALARVAASEYGQPAPGYREACSLLHVDA